MISLRWFGQACFEIKNSVKIATDPHDGKSVGLRPPNFKADLISISHDHYDHSSGKEIVSKQNTEVIDADGKKEIKGISTKGITSYHDKCQGKERGKNLIFVFETGEFRVCHLGDLGHELHQEKANEIKPIDILLTPIGGNFTINATEAINIIEDLEPNTIIPMHYKVKGLTVPISDETEFLREADKKEWKIEKAKKAEMETPSKQRKIILLKCLATKA